MGWKARIGPLFRQKRVVASAGQFLDGSATSRARRVGCARSRRSRPVASTGDPGPRLVGTRMNCATLSAITRWKRLPMTRFLSFDGNRFFEAGQGRAGLHVSTRAWRARLPIARSACSPPMYCVTAMPSSIGRFISEKWTDDPERLKAAHGLTKWVFAQNPLCQAHAPPSGARDRPHSFGR